jgi:cytochrome c-type protein NapC
MRSTVYEEYTETVHFKNASGVRARCSDCHVVHDNWIKMVGFKVGATKELFSHFMGTVDTKEKFEAKRLEMAKNVWALMERTDSRECRHCHKRSAMVLEDQANRARVQHEDAEKEGKTCIDCHKGIAHKPVHKELEKEKEESGEQSFTL